MNERIRELAHQADFIGKKHNGAEWRWGYIDPGLSAKLEQFAELIVAECVKELENNTRCRIAGADKIVAKYFGVEE